MILFCIIYIFIAFIIFFVLSNILKFLFRKEILRKEIEYHKIIDSSKSSHIPDRDNNLVDDEELVAVISAAISSFNNNKSFVIKSIRERKPSVWSIVDRLGNNKNFRL